MFVYIIPMILCLLFHFLKIDKKKKDVLYFLLIGYLFIISAIRYNVGQDYQHWIEVYNWIDNGIEAGGYVETGYKYLNIIIQSIPIFNVYWLFVLTSAIIIFGFGYFIKKNTKDDYLFLSLFLFIGTGVFFASLNLVRQYLSIVIVLYGLKYLYKKEYIKYVVMIVIASLFHTSALIMIAFMIFYYFFKNNRYNKVLIVLYIISLFFIVIDIRQIIHYFSFLIPERWIWYLESDYLNSRNYSAMLKQLAPNLMFLFLLFNKNKIEESKKNDLFFLMFFINVFITNCFYGIMVLVRFSYYFDISLIFIIPIICEIIKDNKFLNILGNFTIWGYYFSLTVVTIFIMNGHGVMPYQTIFSLLT